MSNPQTFYTVGGQDLSGIFQPLGSLTQALSTDYKIPGGSDLNQIFASISSGSQIGYDTGFKVNNVNYPNIDLRQIFAAKVNNTITPTGIYSSTTSGSYTIISFTSSNGTLAINSLVTNTFYYLVVGGGGPGGGGGGGGGGAGGVLQGSFSITGTNTININVGAGGIMSYNPNTVTNGYDTTLTYNSTSIIAKGGGYGGWAYGWGTPFNIPNSGGSGGGGGYNFTSQYGNGTAGQGNNGGSNNSNLSGQGGGGGAGSVGANGGTSQGNGNGGIGIPSNQSPILLVYPSNILWGGGGGGANGGNNNGLGGGGGGGNTGTNGSNGTVNTGGGGGGANSTNGIGGRGGSGIVVIAYLTP